jgi:NAD(P)-dependent dehydrogenase (short-subunit alcohol dehydrogenase family)
MQFGARPIQLDFSRQFVLQETDVDVVINNAGVNINNLRTHEISLEDWNLTIQINLTAPFHVVKQCLPRMIERRWGRIVNISSIYGLRAVEGNFPYTVSKHGLSGLTKTVAKEYAAAGITCNEICPGPIDSDMMREIGSKSGQSVDNYLAEVCDEVPAKRMAKPEEIAALAVFLASEQAAYINGASIPIDGALIA